MTMLASLHARVALTAVLLTARAAGHGEPCGSPHGRAARLAPPATAGSARRAPDDSVVQFRLRDQFGGWHDAADYQGRPVYLVGAGRGGQESATAWAAALGPLVAGTGRATAAVVPVADLQGVPRLLRGLVRGRFPREPAHAVLLDWDGAVSRRLGFDPARATIQVLGPTGRPVLRANPFGVDTASAAAFVRRAQAAVDAATALDAAAGGRD